MDIFNEETLRRLPGSLAIGHTRYSTTGDSALLNAQPIRVDCNKGMIALAHNATCVNANEIRTRLKNQAASSRPPVTRKSLSTSLRSPAKRLWSKPSATRYDALKAPSRW